ncbi:MAG TPA: helix-turn-helix domain-containing protein [Candidatus Limnocylindrales bacterium]|nr:helix-turn-helix domain-containing protein [Candidatus Limnocylindrales bacterium]
MAEERLYSITEVAEKLHVSPATVATWIRLGLSQASHQDEVGRNRWTEADIEAMRRRFQERQARERAGISDDTSET